MHMLLSLFQFFQFDDVPFFPQNDRKNYRVPVLFPCLTISHLKPVPI